MTQDQNELILHCFSNPHGEELLRQWIEQYHLTPVSPDMTTAELWHREGQRSFATYIFNVLEDKRRANERSSSK